MFKFSTTNIKDDFSMKRVSTSLFAQLIQLLPRAEFQHIATKYNTDKASKGVSTWDQFIAMIFAQMAAATSLREISNGLFASVGKLGHVGAQPLAKSTLAYANEHRDYRVFKDFYFYLMNLLEVKIRQKNNRRLCNRFSKPVYSLDSTLLVLTLSLFDWAHYRRAKGGIKIHTILNNETRLPEVLVMTDGKVSDISAARNLQLPTTDCFLIMDRGYSDYEFFAKLSQQGTSFITRLKEGAQTTSFKQGLRAECDTEEEKWGDYDFHFVGQLVPEEIKAMKFRAIDWWDPLEERWFTFVTNDTQLKAQEIARLYRDRWEIEKFFRRLKQNLKIKTFFGTSQNAVLAQIWTAAIAVLVFEGMRALSKFRWGFSLLVWYFRLNLMAFKDLNEWLERPDIQDWKDESPPMQLALF